MSVPRPAATDSASGKVGSSTTGKSSSTTLPPPLPSGSARRPSTARVEKCSTSRSRSRAGLVTTATVSLKNSARFGRSGSRAASGASQPRLPTGSRPVLASAARYRPSQRSQPNARLSPIEGGAWTVASPPAPPASPAALPGPFSRSRAPSTKALRRRVRSSTSRWCRSKGSTLAPSSVSRTVTRSPGARGLGSRTNSSALKTPRSEEKTYS